MIDDAVASLIATANAGRPVRADLPMRESNDAEQALEARFSCAHRLAVYGSLAPGRSNYHVVEPLGGAWSNGFVEGELIGQGWGAQLGYRALVVRAGSPVPVQVLTTEKLVDAWTQLDVFEGAEYRRLLIPVLSQSGEMLTVANIYAAADLVGERRAEFRRE